MRVPPARPYNAGFGNCKFVHSGITNVPRGRGARGEMVSCIGCLFLNVKGTFFGMSESGEASKGR
jgi:hypothetical protein